MRAVSLNAAKAGLRSAQRTCHGRLRRARRRQAPGCGGLTLLEVLAATVVLLSTCIAVTTVVVAAMRGTARAERVSAADQTLLAEAARLRALPFLTPEAAGGAGQGHATRADAVGELFPHADASRETPGGRYIATGDCAGAFESRALVDDAEVTRLARWARCDASGWCLVGLAAVQGWEAAPGVPLPGEALVVRLTVALASSSGLATTPSPGSDRQEWPAASVSRHSETRSLTIVLSLDGSVPAIDAQEVPTGAGDPS